MGKEDCRLFTIAVPAIPITKAWEARMDDGSVVVEGVDTWESIDHGKVVSYKILGMAVPLGHNCNFSRIASAGVGGQGKPHTVVFSAEKDGVIIAFRFCQQKD